MTGTPGGLSDVLTAPCTRTAGVDRWEHVIAHTLSGRCIFTLTMIVAIRVQSKFAPVAQWIVRSPPERKVAGSIPARGT